MGPPPLQQKRINAHFLVKTARKVPFLLFCAGTRTLLHGCTSQLAQCRALEDRAFTAAQTIFSTGGVFFAKKRQFRVKIANCRNVRDALGIFLVSTDLFDLESAESNAGTLLC